MMRLKAGAIWAGYLAPWDKIVYAITVGQKYLMENTTLGIPALFQTEGSNCSPFDFRIAHGSMCRTPWLYR